MMKYSAGIVSRPFWYQETRKTAKLIDAGASKETLKLKVFEENTYQAPTEYRTKQIYNAVVKRLSVMDDYLISEIANADLATSKLLVLISILKTDVLLFEFVYEVFREKILFGEKLIEDKDFNIFWSRKMEQSELVSNWTEYTLDKLKRSYARIMFEAGILDSSVDDRSIIRAVFKPEVHQYLIENGMEAYVMALTGEK